MHSMHIYSKVYFYCAILRKIAHSQQLVFRVERLRRLLLETSVKCVGFLVTFVNDYEMYRFEVICRHFDVC